MRFLVDEDVDVRVIRVLKRLGHEAQRVPAGATNGTVIQLARRAGRVLLTRDSDFTNIALYPPHQLRGIIHIAIHPPWLEKIAPALIQLLSQVPAQEFAGAVFILEENGYHKLP